MATPRLPNDISSAADNVIFKNRAQNIECSFSCVARSTVLLKPNVANILLFNFCEQKFVQHGPIMIAIDCNGLSVLIFEKKWPNYASGPKSPPNSDLFWVRRLFNVCMRIFCAKFKRLHNHIRSMKIICQIRHELSVTVHEISTSWKKKVRWRTLYFFMLLSTDFWCIRLNSGEYYFIYV